MMILDNGLLFGPSCTHCRVPKKRAPLQVFESNIHGDWEFTAVFSVFISQPMLQVGLRAALFENILQGFSLVAY